MEDSILELKKNIISSLNLDIKPEDIDDDGPLFGKGLGLDSIDAIELIVMLDKRYNIKIKQRELANQIFVSVRTMNEYVQANRS